MQKGTLKFHLKGNVLFGAIRVLVSHFSYLYGAVTFGSIPTEALKAHQDKSAIRFELQFLYSVVHIQNAKLAHWIDQTRGWVLLHVFWL